MTIKIKCPVCKATNTLEESKTICRRCNVDMTLIYTIKAHSYKHRVNTILALFEEDYEIVASTYQKAIHLCKEV